MRWRLIVLGCLAIALAIGCAALANVAVDLSYRAQQIFTNAQENQPAPSQMDLSTRLWQQSYGLTLLLTPLAAGSLISALAIPAVLGRRWQLREAAAASETSSRVAE